MWSLLSNSFDRVIGKNLIGYNNKLCACINKTASLIWNLHHLAFEIAWETEKRITEVEPIIIERKIKKKKISFVIINDDFSFNIDCSIINFHTPDLNSENLKNTWAIDFEKSNIAIQIITYYGTLKRDEIKETAYKALISYYETYLRGKRPDERISEIISKPKFSEIKPYMENIFRNGNEKNINELYNQTVVYLIDNDYLRDICFPHDEKILSTSLYSCLKETVETGEKIFKNLDDAGCLKSSFGNWAEISKPYEIFHYIDRLEHLLLFKLAMAEEIANSETIKHTFVCFSPSLIDEKMKNEEITEKLTLGNFLNYSLHG